MRLTETSEGLRIDCRAYSVTLAGDRPYARLADASGCRFADLALIAAVDTAEGPDSTVALRQGGVELGAAGWCVEIEATSTRWTRKRISLTGDERSLWLRVAVEGEGSLTDVRLLGGEYTGDPTHGTGEWLSGAAFRTVFSPEPADPARPCRPATEPASLDVLGGGGNPGSGHWFFTPPPFCFGFSLEPPERSSGIPLPLPRDDAFAAAGRVGGAADAALTPAIPAGPWLTVGLAEQVEAMTFTALRYEPAERAFSLVLRYEGQTRVRGAWQAPALLFRFGDPDPYRGIAGYAGELRRLGLAPRQAAFAAAADPAGRAAPRIESGAAGVPAWWLEPIFCGWGAQSRVAALAPEGSAAAPPPAYSRQALYDRWLGVLGEHGLRPGTVAVDDKWQRTYGDCQPDTDKWPDLRGWIAARHAEGRRVLLWWKAWDPEGLPAELCVRDSLGRAIAADPTNPAYRDSLRATVAALLGPGGLDADGLKVDFTARTPSGSGLTRHGTAWGVALLHELLAIVAAEARRVRPDALVVTHAPNPAFVDVTGMLRLNDMLRFDEPDDPAAVVPEMLHRARIAHAACPDLPIDTDDWCAPDLASWRTYQRLKPRIGVPALYYVDGLDRSGERFDEADYRLLREVWEACSRGASPAASTPDGRSRDSLAAGAAVPPRRPPGPNQP